MSTITHAIGAQGAQLRGALGRLLRGTAETLAMIDAAIRVSSAVERHQNPNPADLKILGLNAPTLNFY